MKQRQKGREKKRIKGIANRPNCIFRNGTVNQVEEIFPPIKLGTGLEVRKGK